MPRFGSITSPASYRPSYSGGTYRSAGIKREAPLVTAYTSRYSTLPSKETVREVSPAPKKTISTNSSKYGATSNDNVKSSRFASTGNLSSAKSKSVDPTPLRVGRPAITVSRVQTRNPSPLATKSYSRSRSRDPSPSEPPKDRFVSSSGYAMPSTYNKLYSKSPSSSYGSKLSVRGSGTRGISASPGPALSYMTASDSSVRIMKRRTEKEERSSKSSTERSPAQELPSNEIESTEAPNTPIEMIEVTVVTRGTSPTLCPTTNYGRTRRIEVAKTIEKTITRPRKMAQCEDKEVQSDRLDDTSKYCRFNSARAPTPWSPYLESKLSYSRFSNGSSVSPSKTPSRESPESSDKSPSKSRESSVTSKSSSASSRSSVAKTASSTTKSSKSKSKSPPTALTKQKSPSTKCLPPPAPKSDSPAKTPAPSSTANGSNGTKWANKDFRKSALNVGPTDRPRKMRHSSADTDSEENRSDDAQRKSMSPLHQQRSERSPSVSSEMSYSSGNNNTNGSTTHEIAKVFAKLKLSGVAVAANAISNERSTVNQTIATPHPHESCAKSDTKSPSPMTKIFTNASSFVVGTEQPSQCYGGNSNEDDVISICENIERITIESALDQTNPTTKTTQINRNNHNFNQIVDETPSNGNWLLNSIDEQRTSSTSDGNSTCQLFINLDDSSTALNMKNKLRHIDSGELPWWMSADDDQDTTADDITFNQTESETQAINQMNDGPSSATKSWLFPPDDPNRSDAKQASPSMYRITHIRSGERAWWMDNDGNEDHNNRNGTNTANGNNHEGSTEPDTSAEYTFKIKRIESGEKAWWMTNDAPDTENTENIDFWSEINEKREQERISRAKIQQERNLYEKSEQERNFYGGLNDSSEGPLGQRASPEGLEDFTSQQRGASPYVNAGGMGGGESFGKNVVKKQFISRHQNIDELLGGTSHTMNLMDQYDNSAPLEEILPTQVRIHDGTAQTAYLQHVGDER